MNSDLVSIICTVKNGEKTITNTIDSVIKQSYEPWELIIVDDGSTDGTVEILEKYSQKNSNIKIFKTSGIGRGQALNRAISYTKGMYICNIDADDLMHPDKLKIQFQCMKENPSYFLTTTDSEIIYDSNSPEWQEYNTQEKIQVKSIEDNIFVDNKVNHSAVMMNRDLLLEIGGYNEKRRSQLDYELWLRAFTSNLKLGLISRKLTAKRIHFYQSYENKKRFLYLYRNTALKVNYMFKYNKKKYRVFTVIILFFLGFLPFKIRRKIRKVVENNN